MAHVLYSGGEARLRASLASVKQLGQRLAAAARAAGGDQAAAALQRGGGGHQQLGDRGREGPDRFSYPFLQTSFPLRHLWLAGRCHLAVLRMKKTGRGW